jgi:ABC-2 type transport system permease protein
MHPAIYMLEKELLHHKIVTRLPLFLLIFSLLIIGSIVMSSNADIEFTLNGMGNVDMPNVQQGFSAAISFAAALVSYLLSILYLSKAMSKERQEGSLPFWRSMPVSDLLTHAVKLGFALLLIPVICSLLVLSAELLLWVFSVFNPHQVNMLIGDITLFSVMQNYFVFLSNMLLIAGALLPFACLMFAVSQMINSPLLYVLISIYVLKFASSLLLPESGLEQFFYQFIDLPTSLILTTDPLQVISQLPVVSTAIMYIVAVLFFMLSLSLQKHGELDLRNMFKG